MAIDNAKNFAKVIVSTGYNASATSIVLNAGNGVFLPTAPFNVTWWNSSDYADPSDDPNVEIVRVTNISTDTLTLIRAQESTSASTKNTGGKTYKMIAGMTAKVINTDLALSLLINSVAFSATPQFDCSLGGIQTIILTANVTSSTAINMYAGQRVLFDIKQGGSGGYTFAWPGNVINPITISSTLNSHSIQEFYSPDGANLYALNTGVL